MLLFYTVFTNVMSFLLLFLLAHIRLTSTPAPTLQMGYHFHVVLCWPRIFILYKLIISRHTHLNFLGGFSWCFKHPQACAVWCRYMSALVEKKFSVSSSRNKHRVFLEWTNTDSFSWSQVWKGQSLNINSFWAWFSALCASLYILEYPENRLRWTACTH